MTVRDDVALLVDGGVPALGGGDTPDRWERLHTWARTGSVSAARLAEAHVDAQSIIEEAGCSASDVSDALYGVWASGGPGSGPTFDRRSGTITGIKPFASGVGVVDRALVTVDDEEGGTWLVEVDLAPASTWYQSSDRWATPALAHTATGETTFRKHPVVRVVGGDGWYLRRPGFWHGAVGPAACWGGATAGLVDLVDRDQTQDPHRLRARGAMRAEASGVLALLRWAAEAADRSFDDLQEAQYRAIAVRSLIERSCTRTVDEFARAWGPRPFVTDESTAQRVADIQLYVRQHHGDVDLVALGSLPSLSEDSR
ncbi:MAG: hypothetical protein ABI239_11325 [Aquihabitans sp.]